MVELALINGEASPTMSKTEQYLVRKGTQTYSSYYNGKMSYTLHGKGWEEYVTETFPDIQSLRTSENVFKAVIDLYAENLIPVPEELRGFSNCVVPLLSRGECLVLVDSAGTPHFPEHFEMISDGRYTRAAIFTRDLAQMQDNVIFATSDGITRLFTKPIPEDFGTTDYKEGFTFVEEHGGNTLFRFALDDKGFGASMAALQDRVNHSIIDQTVVAEMYARPFWYLLNVSIPPKNPYMPAGVEQDQDQLQEHRGSGAAGRIFTSSGEGPFGQLTPPTITDMIAYHDSISDKVSQSSGIPQFYFKPGSGAPPTGVALKVLSKRFNNRVARMREDLEENLKELAALLGVEKTAEVAPAAKRGVLKKVTDKLTGKPDPQPEMDYELWAQGDDLLQEALDQHGINLSQMGYPLDYIASVVTPGVDLADYQDDTLGQPGVDPSKPGQATDMTAMGQPGLPATPGQVAAYGQNPGQRAKA